MGALGQYSGTNHLPTEVNPFERKLSLAPEGFPPYPLLGDGGDFFSVNDFGIEGQRLALGDTPITPLDSRGVMGVSPRAHCAQPKGVLITISQKGGYGGKNEFSLRSIENLLSPQLRLVCLIEDQECFAMGHMSLLIRRQLDRYVIDQEDLGV